MLNPVHFLLLSCVAAFKEDPNITCELSTLERVRGALSTPCVTITLHLSENEWSLDDNVSILFDSQPDSLGVDRSTLEWFARGVTTAFETDDFLKELYEVCAPMIARSREMTEQSRSWSLKSRMMEAAGKVDWAKALRHGLPEGGRYIIDADARLGGEVQEFGMTLVVVYVSELGDFTIGMPLRAAFILDSTGAYIYNSGGGNYSHPPKPRELKMSTSIDPTTKKFPDTLEGATQALRALSHEEFPSVTDGFPDPQVYGCWKLEHGAEDYSLVWLAGHKDPTGFTRPFNDFETTVEM